MPSTKESTNTNDISDLLDGLSNYLNKDDSGIFNQDFEPEAKKTAEEEDIAYSDNQKWAAVEKKQALKQERQLHQLRKKILPKLFWLSVCWILFVAVTIVATGIQAEWNKFYVGDSVLIVLLTTTTTTVLGLFAIAANWLFPKK